MITQSERQVFRPLLLCIDGLHRGDARSHPLAWMGLDLATSIDFTNSLALHVTPW